jgi:hypothetical protein
VLISLTEASALFAQAFMLSGLNALWMAQQQLLAYLAST